MWFVRDLRAIDAGIASFLAVHFSDGNTAGFKLCANCFKSCKSLKLPDLGRSNGYRYPPKPMNLPELDPLTTRSIDQSCIDSGRLNDVFTLEIASIEDSSFSKFF